jgi:hypothetical protein
MAAGEYKIACGYNLHNAGPLVRDKGAPLGLVYPDPLPLELGIPMHLPKGTPAPASGQLLVLWLATKGQAGLANLYRELPWSKFSEKSELAKGKYLAVCGIDCVLKGEQLQQEHGRILGLPGS